MRLTDEQEELGTAVRSVPARHQSSAAWGPLTRQIGVAGLAVPEEYGGAGYGALEVHVVMEELGRVLSPLPFLGSAVVTAQALLASGDKEACARLLPGLAEGHTVVALAWAEQGSWDAAAVQREHDAHRYFKRSHSGAQLFGAPARHRARIALEVGLLRTRPAPQEAG